ncbi:MAG: rod shape-determining protein MreD [Deltaproteobacteria bacterium]|nr:rod shape-determining protein MreD [Deltaproteobacteria bacterium]
MKVFIIYLTLGLIFLTFQTTLLQTLLPSGLIPDIPLVMIFYLGFHRGSMDGLITSFSLGCLADIFSGGIVGVTPLSFISIFVMVYFMAKRVVFHSLLTKIGGTTAFALLKGGIVYLILMGLTSNPEIPFLTVIVPSAVLTGMISPAIFNLLDRVENLYQNE